MKIKRILSLVLAAAMMAVVFVGCTKSEDTSSKTSGAAKTVDVEKNAKLKLWGSAASLSILKEQAKAFEKKYADKNVKIEVVAQEEGDAVHRYLATLKLLPMYFHSLQTSSQS